MECGVIYMKFVPSDSASWIKYCYIFSALPKDLKEGIKGMVRTMHKEYIDDMIIPITVDAQLGCLVKPNCVDKIAETLYGMGAVLLNNLNVDPSVRLVYSIGEIKDVNVRSIHNVKPDGVIVNVGKYLDVSNAPGIFKI
jgi:hypothetical protein